jgi:hypothetical protein
MQQHQQSQQDEHDTSHELFELLLDKVAKDPYPSSTMMDLIEELLTPEDVPVYAAVLMDKIRKDQFPSLDLMTRVRDLG